MAQVCRAKSRWGPTTARIVRPNELVLRSGPQPPSRACNSSRSHRDRAMPMGRSLFRFGHYLSARRGDVCLSKLFLIERLIQVIACFLEQRFQAAALIPFLSFHGPLRSLSRRSNARLALQLRRLKPQREPVALPGLRVWRRRRGTGRPRARSQRPPRCRGRGFGQLFGGQKAVTIEVMLLVNCEMVPRLAFSLQRGQSDRRSRYRATYTHLRATGRFWWSASSAEGYCCSKVAARCVPFPAEAGTRDDRCVLRVPDPLLLAVDGNLPSAAGRCWPSRPL